MRLEALMRQLGGQFLRLGQRAAVDENALDRPHGGMGPDEMRAQGASTHQRQCRCIRAGQVIGGERGGRGGAPAGDLAAIHHGNGGARILLDQQITGLDRRQPLRGVVGLEHHRLQSRPVLRPGRHEQQGRDCRHVMVVAHRRFDLGAEAFAQRLHDVAIGAKAGHVVGVQNLHG